MKEYYSREEAADRVRGLGYLFGLIFYHFANILIETHGEEGRRLIQEA